MWFDSIRVHWRMLDKDYINGNDRSWVRVPPAPLYGAARRVENVFSDLVSTNQGSVAILEKSARLLTEVR